MSVGKKLAWSFGIIAAAAAGVLVFGKANEQDLYKCPPENPKVSALVVKWRLTGGYGLAILNADDRVAYAENNDKREPLEQKAAQFCSVGRLTIGN